MTLGSGDGARCPNAPVVEEPPVVADTPFECKSESYIFSSDTNSKFSRPYRMSLSDGTVSKGDKFGTHHINSTGYNVKDNYIYGIEYGGKALNRKYSVVKIDKDFNVEKISIPGLPQGGWYALGDVSPEGKFHVSQITSDGKKSIVNNMYVIDLDKKSFTTIPLKDENKIVCR